MLLSLNLQNFCRSTALIIWFYIYDFNVPACCVCLSPFYWLHGAYCGNEFLQSLWMRPLFVRAKCGINWLFCVSNHKAVVMVNTSLSRHISAPFKSCFSLEVWEGFSLSSLWSLCLLCPSAQYLKNHVMINHSDGYCLPTLDSIASFKM